MRYKENETLGLGQRIREKEQEKNFLLMRHSPFKERRVRTVMAQHSETFASVY